MSETLLYPAPYKVSHVITEGKAILLKRFQLTSELVAAVEQGRGQLGVDVWFSAIQMSTLSTGIDVDIRRLERKNPIAYRYNGTRIAQNEVFALKLFASHGYVTVEAEMASGEKGLFVDSEVRVHSLSNQETENQFALPLDLFARVAALSPFLYTERDLVVFGNTIQLINRLMALSTD